jgi:hypothetical protein
MKIMPIPVKMLPCVIDKKQNLSHDLRQSRRLVNVNRSKRSDYEPPEGGYSSNILN